jgi:hypothetical protein
VHIDLLNNRFDVQNHLLPARLIGPEENDSGEGLKAFDLGLQPIRAGRQRIELVMALRISKGGEKSRWRGHRNEIQRYPGQPRGFPTGAYRGNNTLN